MKLNLIGIAAVIAMTTSTGAHADSYVISREGSNREQSVIHIRRNDIGKAAPQPERTYISDGKGNLRDPVTGWPKGRNY